MQYLGPLEKGTILTGLENREYRILSPLGEGGKGRAYLAVHGGKEYVIKAPKLSDEFPLHAIKERLASLDRSAKLELEDISPRFEGSEFIVTAIDLCLRKISLEGVQRGRQAVATLHVQPFVKGMPLDTFMESRYPDQVRASMPGEVAEFCGVPTFEVWHKWAVAISNRITEVHRQRVVHSDLWPPNIIIRDRDEAVHIIDFGEAWSAQDEGFKIATGERSHQYLAPERRASNRAWRTAVDIYSLGGILLFLAAGNVSGLDPIEDSDQLREVILTTIRERNNKILMQSRGIVDIIHRCLRYRVGDRAQTVAMVLDDLNLISPVQPQSVDEQKSKILEELQACQDIVRDSVEPNPLFVGFVKRQISLLRQSVDSCRDDSRLFEIYGDREEILKGMLYSLQALGPGDLYAAVSLPSLWCKTALGLRGRFYSTSLDAAKRGVIIKRVFMVEDRELASGRVQDVLSVHRKGLLEQGRTQYHEGDKLIDNPNSYIGVQVMSRAEREENVGLGRNFTLIRKMDPTTGQNEYTRIALDYQLDVPDPEHRAQVTSVRLWSLDDVRRRNEYLEQLQIHLEKSQPIHDIAR